jgi:hypothetical protein
MPHGREDKQPFEEKDYAFDFSPQLLADETITLISCEATNLLTEENSTEVVIGDAPAPVVAGQTVVFWLKDGTDGERHNISIKVNTSKGQKLEGDIDLFVIEVR